MNQQEDLEKEIQQIGERIALLLVAADLPDDVKAGFATMIPQMTPLQLDRLINILEANVKDTAASQEQALGHAVQEAQAMYEAQRKSAEKKAMQSLEDIESILNHAQS